MNYKAICCVLGAILINLTLGTFYSIGNLGPYIASYMRANGNPDVTSEHATWITATFLLGQGLFIILGSYIEQYYNSRIACIFGCIIHCASTYLTIWAINVNITTVILVYGLGSGLGCGSAYMASIIAAQKWFPARKGVFTGVIVAGFGFGGLIFTNLQTLFMNPNNIPPETTGYFNSEVYRKVPNLFLYSGIVYTVVQFVGCALAFPPPTSGLGSTQNASVSLSYNAATGTFKELANRSNATTVVTDDVLPVMRNLMSTFSHRIFYIIGIMMMLVAPGVTFVNSLGKRFGQSFISDDRFLATVVAVAAVANASGRLTWGYLADKFSFSTCYTLKVFIFACLIALFPFEFILSSKICYLIWMLGLFFGFSGTFVLFPVFVEQVFGAKYHGIIYGILYLFLALSSIITSLLIQITVGPALANQQLKPSDKLNTRIWPCSIIAACYIVSLVIFLLVIPIRRLENAIKHRKELELARTRTLLANRPDLLQERANKGLYDNSANEIGVNKENSLGSIVKFTEAAQENDQKLIRPLRK